MEGLCEDGIYPGEKDKQGDSVFQDSGFWLLRSKVIENSTALKRKSTC